jgi:hypothetical protein
MSQQRIVQLAATISENVAKIDSYLKANGFADISFDIDTPFQSKYPEEISALRTAVLDANTELSDLLLGPKEIFVEYQVRTVLASFPDTKVKEGFKLYILSKCYEYLVQLLRLHASPVSVQNPERFPRGTRGHIC